MKTRNKNIMIHMIGSAVMMALVVIIGCSDAVKENKLKALFAQRTADAIQHFTMDASTGGTVTGSKGVIIECIANAFKDAEGETVSGNVDIELIEALNYRDMLAIDKQTVGNDNGSLRPLTSGGQIYLNVEKDGEKVGLAENGCSVKFPTTSLDSEMKIFRGELDDEGSLIWNQTDDALTTIASVEDITPPYYFYQIPAIDILEQSGIGWINCDYFNITGPRTDVVFQIPSEFSRSSTSSVLMWAVIPEINSLAGIGYYSPDDYGVSFGVTEYGFTGSSQLEIGTEIIVVALYVNDAGEYYSSFNPVTVTEGLVLPITFQATTLQQFDLDVQGL